MYPTERSCVEFNSRSASQKFPHVVLTQNLIAVLIRARFWSPKNFLNICSNIIQNK
jgi:hypothetical protein